MGLAERLEKNDIDLHEDGDILDAYQQGRSALMLIMFPFTEEL